MYTHLPPARRICKRSGVNTQLTITTLSALVFHLYALHDSTFVLTFTDLVCVLTTMPQASRNPGAIFGLILCLQAGTVAAKVNTSTLMRGWTSWDLSAITGSSIYGREWLTADHVLQQSAALASSGMQEHGYVYINVDSFWASDPTQDVDAYGRWTYNTTRFPNGIRAIADAVHARGQKFGIYLNPGVAVAAVKQATPIEGTNCTAADIAETPWTGGNVFWDTYKINFSSPCAIPYIQSFANLLALDWTVDFLKMDAVSPGSDNSNVSAYDNRQDIAAWSAALEATGRDVWLTISWAIDPSYAADFTPYSNAWRTSDDVDCYCNTLVEWSSVLRIFTQVRPWLNYTGEIGRPDPDALDVGQGTLDGLTDAEKLSYATLWAIIGAPLYTGNDLTVLDSYGQWLFFGSPAVLSINAAAITAFPTAASTSPTGPQVWAINYNNGTYVIALFNLGDSDSTVTAPFVDFMSTQHSTNMHYTGTDVYTATDVWNNTSLGSYNTSFTTTYALPPHGVQLVRLEATS
jgi:hypothetical protein